MAVDGVVFLDPSVGQRQLRHTDEIVRLKLLSEVSSVFCFYTRLQSAYTAFVASP